MAEQNRAKHPPVRQPNGNSICAVCTVPWPCFSAKAEVARRIGLVRPEIAHDGFTWWHEVIDADHDND